MSHSSRTKLDSVSRYNVPECDAVFWLHIRRSGLRVGGTQLIQELLIRSLLQMIKVPQYAAICRRR